MIGNSVFQMVFQKKNHTVIFVLNHQLMRQVQITPAHQTRSKPKPAKCGFCCIWGVAFPPPAVFAETKKPRPRTFPSNSVELHELASTDS